MTQHNHPHLIHPQYRPDIDGLRALAILSVVVFHAFPEIIPGGYIGVDIFFVISGYLISTIIFSSLERDRFSLIEFYIRRIRRIFPSLIFVLITSLVLGWYVLFADEYKQLGKHTAASAGFIQNFILLRESGYFDNGAETKPLLHLWSLAVEEQFYIFWPLLLAFVWKRQWSFLKITAVIALISFATNIYLMQRHHTAAFYLPISRFWELMVGGVLAYTALHRSLFLTHDYKSSQSLFGFILIIFGLLILNNGSYFPGWWALLPTLGAFLIISAGPNAWLNLKFLSNKLMVWIGLISYPLYLWHWLLLSYLRIVVNDASGLEKLGAVATAFVLAWLTYKFVEQPLRFGKNASIKALTLLVLLFIIGILGGTTWFQSGFPGRSINAKLDFVTSLEVFEGSRISDGSCEKFNSEKEVSEEVCLSNSTKPQVLFVGDSHAMALYSAIFAKEFPLNSILISGHSCPVYPNLSYTPNFQYSWRNNCTEIAQRALLMAEKYKSIRTIVIANVYTYPTADSAFHFRLNGIPINPIEAFAVGNGYFIERMLSLGKKVVFVEDVPNLRHDPRQCVERIPFMNAETCEKSPMDIDIRRQIYSDSLLKLMDKHPAISIFRTNSIFCNADKCMSHIGNHWLYNDSNHISVFASNMLLQKIMNASYLSHE